MALATKCPHCNTTFRVAHDQLKLRGGIVRCGACNEVFDGNAALVEPVPRTPVIIDLPEANHDTAPVLADGVAAAHAGLAPQDEAGDTGAGEEAARHAEAAALAAEADNEAAALAEAALAVQEARTAPDAGDQPEPAPAADAAQEPTFGAVNAPPHGLTPDPSQETTSEAALAPDAATDLPTTTAPEPDLDFDLDLNGDEPPASAAPVPPVPAHAGHAAADAAPIPDDAFDLDFDIDGVHADPATTPPADAHRFDGRREPTLDIPDDHVAAVALHDSFELDAYPHVDDSGLHSADERAHAMDAGVWRARDEVHHLGDEPAADASGMPRSLASDDHPAADIVAAAPAPQQEDDDADDDIVTLSSAAAAGAAAALAPEPSAPATPVSAREPDEPGFVKRSRRQERWGKASRIAMACALPLLLAGLAYQAVATFRNPLAAAVPALKPALVSACALMGCKVELPSQLDALSIEQGELQTMADNIFSFSTSLRNQSATAQSWPHVELILNDGADKPVLRRVFAPRDYLPASADAASGFLPRSEQPVKLYFELSRVKASGYHIAVFYP